jgi:hypothetical protein
VPATFDMQFSQGSSRDSRTGLIISFGMKKNVN